MYTCRCQCGKTKDVSVYNLLNGTSTSCGCTNKSNIANKKFGFLTAIEPIGNGKKGVIWECKCRCGNMVNVPVMELTWRRSCGCMKKIEKEEHTKITWVTNGGQKLRSNNTSGVSGVNRANGKWGARITFKGEVYWLGTYESKEDAVIARKTAESHLYTDFLEWWSKKRKDDKNE